MCSRRTKLKINNRISWEINKAIMPNGAIVATEWIALISWYQWNKIKAVLLSQIV
jgi:hypothetical protein